MAAVAAAPAADGPRPLAPVPAPAQGRRPRRPVLYADAAIADGFHHNNRNHGNDDDDDPAHGSYGSNGIDSGLRANKNADSSPNPKQRAGWDGDSIRWSRNREDDAPGTPAGGGSGLPPLNSGGLLWPLSPGRSDLFGSGVADRTAADAKRLLQQPIARRDDTSSPSTGVESSASAATTVPLPVGTDSPAASSPSAVPPTTAPTAASTKSVTTLPTRSTTKVSPKTTSVVTITKTRSASTETVVTDDPPPATQQAAMPVADNGDVYVYVYVDPAGVPYTTKTYTENLVNDFPGGATSTTTGINSSQLSASSASSRSSALVSVAGGSVQATPSASPAPSNSSSSSSNDSSSSTMLSTPGIISITVAAAIVLLAVLATWMVLRRRQQGKDRGFGGSNKPYGADGGLPYNPMPAPTVEPPGANHAFVAAAPYAPRPRQALPSIPQSQQQQQARLPPKMSRTTLFAKMGVAGNRHSLTSASSTTSTIPYSPFVPIGDVTSFQLKDPVDSGSIFNRHFSAFIADDDRNYTEEDPEAAAAYKTLPLPDHHPFNPRRVSSASVESVDPAHWQPPSPSTSILEVDPTPYASSTSLPSSSSSSARAPTARIQSSILSLLNAADASPPTGDRRPSLTSPRAASNHRRPSVATTAATTVAARSLSPVASVDSFDTELSIDDDAGTEVGADDDVGENGGGGNGVVGDVPAGEGKSSGLRVVAPGRYAFA
ncbi:hypothetical protein DFJ73DRAFT_779824 [Zopfochytrium polystomum]|nr:hypothetical protein DFJ73DRAFT_779824 [Zopfochytrium polystomum]